MVGQQLHQLFCREEILSHLSTVDIMNKTKEANQEEFLDRYSQALEILDMIIDRLLEINNL
jgi:hypothetical protein